MPAQFRKDADHPHFGEASEVVLNDAQFAELKKLLTQIRDAILDPDSTRVALQREALEAQS